MKKIIFILSILCITISLYSCENNEVKIDYGKSELYSKEDIDSAIKEVTHEFYSWDGCKLYKLEYAGDDYCKENIDYCNELGDGKEFTDCIIFKSVFRSPKFGGGAWEANEIYEDWQWILGREKNGSWNLLTWGYA